MLFYEIKSLNPYYNLATEEYFFSQADPSEEYFLLWQNERTVVVGRYQNTWEEVNKKYIDEHDIHVVRRLSGGGAVYHDTGNLNYSFIVDKDKFETFNFQAFTQPLMYVLRELGLRAETSGRNDVAINGRKISGSAQHVRGSRLLHHGCIMLDSDLSALSGALNVKQDKIVSKSFKSVRSRVTTINENLPEPISMESFRTLLRRYILKAGGRTLVSLDADAEKAIHILQQRYESWEWNYGVSAKFMIRKDRRFPFGEVTLFMNIESGIIQDISICGDFFGSQDISGLEKMIKGRKLLPESFRSLEQVDLNRFIFGITPEQLIELICY